MKNKLISALSVASVLACAGAYADEFESNGLTIITDNFKVEDNLASSGDKTDQSLLIVRAENEIASLGDKKVVYGEKNPEHLAFVKDENDHNYIITDKLLVQCNKDVYCIPAGLEVSQISSSIYEITVRDYEQWSALREELGNTAGVRSVSPSYDYGLEPSLK